MPRNNRVSSIDRHPDRSEIEALLCRRVSLRTLQDRYGMDASALCRHRKKMKLMRPATYAALEAADWNCTAEELERIKTEAGEGVIVKLKSQIDKLIAAQDAAFEIGQFAGMAQISEQVLSALRVLGEFTQSEESSSK